MPKDWKIVEILSGVAKRIYTAVGCALITCLIFYIYFGVFIAFLMFLLLTLGVLYHAQDNMLFHPNLPPNSRTYIPLPTMHNLPYENVNLHLGQNITLHGFLIKQPGEKCKESPTVVYYHGNAGNIGHRLQNAWGIFYNLHCNIFMIEYRGYGLSTGSPSEKGIVQDGKAAIDYLHTRTDLDLRKIVVFGRSLGGAVAINIASDISYFDKIMCIIVENTFTSIPDMAVELIHPGIRFLPTWFFKNKFESIKRVSSISVPCLLISGLADNLVPSKMMRMLYINCGSQNKKLLELPGGSHNDTWIVDGYYQGILTFLNDCFDEKPLLIAPKKINLWREIQEV